MSASVPERLRMERQKLDLTQAEMAARLVMPVVTYRSYESGRSAPPLGLVPRLQDAGIDAYFIATGVTSAELARNQLDWQLVAEVCLLVQNSSASRPRPYTSAEFAKFVALGYQWVTQLGRPQGRQLIDDVLRAA